MKKFYSFVLMATALLIGTNVWAQEEPEEDNMTASELRSLFNNVTYGLDEPTTITLTKDVVFNVSSDEPIWIGTAGIEDDAQSIILDLNGYNIKTTGTTSSNFFMFILTHGELLVRNNDLSKTSEIQMTATCGSNSAAFIVTGSYKSNGWNADGDELTEAGRYNTRSENVDYFSHLELGERVKIVSNKPGIGIQLDEVALNLTASNFFKDHLKYQTDFFRGTGGFAYGVRVDVYGDISITGSGAKSYAIKANGMIASSLNTEYTLNAYIDKWNNMTSEEYQAYLTYYGNYADRKEQHKKDTIDAPFVHVHNTSNLKSAHEIENAAAIYAAGYAKWLIEGHCEGNLGLSVKSGTFEIHDATIESTAQTHTAPQGGTGSTGTGSAILLNSVDGYSGNMQMTISGDSKITATAGNAIEEKVNTYEQPNPDYDPEDPESKETKQETKLQNVTILGGTFEGGEDPTTHEAQPAIVVTSKKEDEDVVVAYGGTFNNMTKGEIETLAPNTEDYHATPVEVDGKTVLVISEGTAPSSFTTWNAVVTAGAGNWTEIGESGVTVTLSDDVTLSGELQMISGDASHLQTIIIPDQKTLTVKNIMMSDYARIIVRAGGKLIVTGTQGIIAPKNESITLEANGSAQAIFLFNPAVSSNRHPNATVELYTNAKQIGDASYVYDHFAIPTYDGEKTAYSIDGGFPASEACYGQASFIQSVYGWNVIGTDWTLLARFKDMKRFNGYQLTNNTAAGGLKYLFKGELVGNVEDSYDFVTNDFHYFGNSYMAEMSLNKFFANLNDDIYKGVWVYDAGLPGYRVATQFLVSRNRAKYSDNTLISDIRPMQAFIMYLQEGNNASAPTDYANAIWGNPKYGLVSTSNDAPVRNSVASTEDWATIRISAANGVSDEVIMCQSDEFTSAFDNGADAPKYLNKGINLYAATNDGKFSVVATNELNNTILSFEAGEATEYTLQIAEVEGHEFTLFDNVTGVSVLMNEGATYTFTQDANTVVPARFVVLNAPKVASAIDNVEETAKVSGIYTITGQYLGRDFNVLPAGMYIVNGVKVVK